MSNSDILSISVFLGFLFIISSFSLHLWNTGILNNLQTSSFLFSVCYSSYPLLFKDDFAQSSWLDDHVRDVAKDQVKSIAKYTSQVGCSTDTSLTTLLEVMSCSFFESSVLLVLPVACYRLITFVWTARLFMGRTFLNFQISSLTIFLPFFFMAQVALALTTCNSSIFYMLLSAQAYLLTD